MYFFQLKKGGRSYGFDTNPIENFRGDQFNMTNHSGKCKINFSTIATQALQQIDRLLEQWLPNGKREGSEYVALNPKRSDKSRGSFKVNIASGLWADSATNDRGRDLISLYAYLHDIRQSEAALEITKQIERR